MAPLLFLILSLDSVRLRLHITFLFIEIYTSPYDIPYNLWILNLGLLKINYYYELGIIVCGTWTESQTWFIINATHLLQHSTASYLTMVDSSVEWQPRKHLTDIDITKILSLAQAIMPQWKIVALIKYSQQAV